MLKTKKTKELIMLSIVLIFNSIVWWINTIKETAKEGFHNKTVAKGIKIGIILFIMSEVLFFSRFFWTYFHSRVSPDLNIGQKWPPQHIESFRPINVPLLNTIVLVRSGISITWAHHSLIQRNFNKFKKTIWITCLLGWYFTAIQTLEYRQASFSLRDSSYGSIFYIATGFHGLHVIIGSSFIFTCLKMSTLLAIDKKNHIRIEMSAWYWHFVDIIWLYLYLAIYWWGS